MKDTLTTRIKELIQQIKTDPNPISRALTYTNELTPLLTAYAERELDVNFDTLVKTN